MSSGIPSGTYRLQLHGEFNFKGAMESSDGIFSAVVKDLGPGAHYVYLIDVKKSGRIRFRDINPAVSTAPRESSIPMRSNGATAAGKVSRSKITSYMSTSVIGIYRTAATILPRSSSTGASAGLPSSAGTNRGRACYHGVQP